MIFLSINGLYETYKIFELIFFNIKRYLKPTLFNGPRKY